MLDYVVVESGKSGIAVIIKVGWSMERGLRALWASKASASQISVTP